MCYFDKKNLIFIKKKELHNFNKISLKWIKSLTNLLTGDKFMPELHLKELRFTYSAYGSFTKHPERIQKTRETGN